jgi:hypothetical protein
MLPDGRAQLPDGRASSGGSTAGAQGGGSQSGGAGRNPYESPVTGSYPYPSQPYSEPPTAGRDVYDDRSHRQSATDGYGAASPNGPQGGTGTGSYPSSRYDNQGSGYTDPRDGRY